MSARAMILLLIALPCCVGGGPRGAGGDPPPAPGMPPEGPPALPLARAATPPASPACRQAPPAPVFHRLNRSEYQNSVNTLLGTALPLRDQLPVDSLLYGFDNNADAAVSAPLLQRYLDIARDAVAAALADVRARDRLIPCALEREPGCARRVVEGFLTLAFRRPAAADEVDEHLGLARACDDSPLAGVACAFEAALVSPHFLFRTELLDAAPAACRVQAPFTPAAGDSDLRLGPYALAARLSFFLWSSAPDRELHELAAAGRLDDPAVIEAQVNRMLAPAAQARFLRPLVESLPVLWLGLDDLDSAAPSPLVYPRFDEDLRRAMAAEARLYFADILQHNRSALELLKAPFTYANQRLASHYGLPPVPGPDLRKVDTSAGVRGGVLTQGSFLTITASSENTSVSRRARWVLQNLLCTSLGDPPPGAEEQVPAPPPSLGLSNRQSLEQRTGQPPCSACHQLLNPIGFGLEIFDGIGAERAHDEQGRPIDASGALPGMGSFADTAGLLALLQADPRFPACLTQKLLTQALGRGLSSACDREAVQVLAEAFREDGYRLKNHVVRIAKSELFLSARRRGEEPAP
jgi:hypothetical protein